MDYSVLAHLACDTKACQLARLICLRAGLILKRPGSACKFMTFRHKLVLQHSIVNYYGSICAAPRAFRLNAHGLIIENPSSAILQIIWYIRIPNARTSTVRWSVPYLGGNSTPSTVPWASVSAAAEAATSTVGAGAPCIPPVVDPLEIVRARACHARGARGTRAQRARVRAEASDALAAHDDSAPARRPATLITILYTTCINSTRYL